MLRKFITICLFSFTVPFAVFGQNTFGHDDVKNLGESVGEFIHEQWPKAQKSVKKNFPTTAQTVAGTLNALDPSAGGNPKQVNFVEKPSPWFI